MIDCTIFSLCFSKLPIMETRLKAFSGDISKLLKIKDLNSN